MLCYQQSSAFRFKGEAKDLTKYSNPDSDPLGPWMSDNLTGLANAAERPNLHYDIVNPETGTPYPPHPTRGWIYGPERMAQLISAHRILWPKKRSGRPRLKRYLSDMQSETTGFSTVLEAPGNVEATKELNEIFGAKVFTFPKPLGLIRQVIEQATEYDDIVVDFFAGSGTTAHAVLDLNAADGGSRRFVLVSNTEATELEPQKNLCRDVCAERIRRVISGYTYASGKNVPGAGGNFAYALCRRIPPGRLIEIDHEQVWTALQLIHCDSVSAYRPSALISAGDEEQALGYVPQFSRDCLQPIQQALTRSRALILYSWEPELLRQHVQAEHVQIEHIPESLARRFGLKG
jgi:adenine-specific DNA-methyltransferase